MTKILVDRALIERAIIQYDGLNALDLAKSMNELRAAVDAPEQPEKTLTFNAGDYEGTETMPPAPQAREMANDWCNRHGIRISPYPTCQQCSGESQKGKS